VIGCGASAPISTYIEASGSPFPIYGNPGIELYKLFEFKSNLAGSKKGEEKEYESDLGGIMTRTWSALKEGPMRNISHVNSVGPKSQNGGEVILEAGKWHIAPLFGRYWPEAAIMTDNIDGTCSFLHRMEHAADHTEIKALTEKIGAQYTPLPDDYQRKSIDRRKSSTTSTLNASGERRASKVGA